MRWTWPCLAAVALGGLAVLPAAPEKEKAAPTLTDDDRKLAEENQILPLPGEVLAVMKAQEAADWDAAARSAMSMAAPEGKMNSVEAAARLGVRVADAFLAIQSENQPLMEKCAGEILAAATKLGASKETLASGEQIRDLAAAGKWTEIVPLLDSTYQGAIDAMEELGDDESASIAAAAGWLRGIQIYAGQLAASYSEDTSKALRQAELIDTVAAKVKALSGSVRNKAPVAGYLDALAKIKPLVDVGQDATIKKETVEQIAAIAKTAVEGK
jgi:hypothetical protein